MTSKTFESQRLQLRPMREEDATERYASWLNDAEVNRFLATKSTTIEELRDYIKQKNAQENTEFYGIFLREDGRHIGTTKLEPIDFAHKVATLGIMIGDKREWGKGYAGEAMRMLIEYCFTELGLDSVALGVVAQNTSALKAYQKLGFKEVSRTVGSITYQNEVFDQVNMILKKDASM